MLSACWTRSPQKPSSSARCWPTRGCAPGSTGARPGPAIPRAAWLTTSPRSSPRSRPTTRCADDLRLLALVHDSFKAEVRPHERWSPDNDHATLARRFAERYTSDERLLATLELHDEPYWIWRHADTPGAGAADAPGTVARPRAVRPLRRARRRQRGQGPHLPVVVSARARDQPDGSPRIRRPVPTGTEGTSSTSRHSPPSRTSSRPSRTRRASSSPSSGPGWAPRARS